MKEKPFNLTSFEGNKGKNPMKDAIFQMMEDIEIHKEYKKLKAKLDKSYYTELLAEGFTKEQALELVKSTNYGS